MTPEKIQEIKQKKLQQCIKHFAGAMLEQSELAALKHGISFVVEQNLSASLAVFMVQHSESNFGACSVRIMNVRYSPRKGSPPNDVAKALKNAGFERLTNHSWTIRVNSTAKVDHRTDGGW